jgi:hypothetical protein
MLTRPLVCQGQGVITAVAGTGVNSSGGDGSPATSARFIATVDTAGNFHIADGGQQRRNFCIAGLSRIRKVTRAKQ